MHCLWIKHASQLVQVSNTGVSSLTGDAMKDIVVIDDGSMVIDANGIIEAVGTTSDLENRYGNVAFQKVLDANGMCIIPGLVDGHTHPVWCGDRVHEFAMKLAGATYLEVHKMGGGIGFTVEHIRRASEEELYTLLIPRLDAMLRHGTTLIEAKSGYGLETEAELKMLRVLHRASITHPIDIVSNFLGAHSVPKGSDAASYAKLVCDEQIPAVVASNARNETSVEFVDVFHEKGVFEGVETRQILQAAKEAGFLLNFHGDELHPMESGVLAAELHATAVSHCEHVSEEGMRQMAAANVAAVLLPTTAYMLRIAYPPARALIAHQVPVALGSDFNPNAHCLSLPMVMHLSCVNMHLTMEEALVAATLNAAASMNRAEKHGSLEVGKCGDFVVLDATHWKHLIYALGDEPIRSVWKSGQCVYQRPDTVPVLRSALPTSPITSQ